MNIDQLTQQGDNSSRLQQMLNSDLLSQLTFDCLMRHYSIINASHDLLQRIPDNKFTEAVFCRIIAICQENTINPTAATRRINDYIQHTVLGIARQVPAQLTVTELNTTQSTHTTSVHQSVSASAARLAQRYFIQWRSQSGERCTKEELGNYITQVTKKTYKEIDDYIRHLPESRENSIAQRCWGRLITHGFLNFQDPSSKILTGHLVTLFWTAVHDLAIRNYNKKDLKATVIEEGRALFTRALYEIQRDGNINEQDLDDEADEDKVPSCAAGTFNKFIEKLNTVHPDVELIVTTRTGAINRFQILVKQHCFETMKQQINEAKKKGEVLAPETIENAIEQLWPTIQPIVSDLLFKEYGSIYMNNTQNADFTALIQLGPEVTFTEEQVQALQQLNTPVAAGKKHQREEEEEETAAAEEQISAIVDHGFFAQKPNDQNDKQPPAGQAPGFD